MKKVLIGAFLVIFLFPILSQDRAITVDGVEYNITIPDDLEEAYLRAITSYLEESNDYESMSSEYDKYKTSAETLIASKDNSIKNQADLIILKDKIIKDLKASRDMFSIIPSVSYGVSPTGSSAGIGVGILLFDSFLIQAQGSYPPQAHFSVGWKF